MARKVWLTITGIQKGFEQEEPVTLVTEGSYIYKNDVHYIFYSERTEEGAVIKNRLTISPGSVELRKTGAGNFNSVLVFDTQHNKNCIYQSPELLSRPYYVNVDLSKYIALLIDSLNHDHSISELLDPNEKIHKLLLKYNNHEI